MKKYYFHLIILLTAVSFAFSADKYNFSWSSLANNSGLISSLKTTDASALPDSINQIKNVRAGIDLDNDGKKEFMFPAVWVDDDGVTARRSIFLYENTGNNSYDMVWSYQFPGVADQFTTVDVSDLDGDGNLEILAVNVRAEGDNDAGPNLYVFEYTGVDNDYGTEPVVTWDLGGPGRDVVRVAKAADFDGDGKQEVVMTCFLTQPAIVIASVSDFSIPVWTTEYVNNEIGGSAPDIAAIGVGDMDNDNTPEIVLTEGATDKLLIIEATAANTYSMNEVDMPVAGKTVSVHSIEMGDINGDGKDEAFIANLQGTVWVVTAPGDVLAITTGDIHAIATTDQQWLEAGLGDLGLGGIDFVIAASNGSTAEDYRYVGGNGGDVTDSTNYVSETVVSLADIEAIVPGGVRVYGLDFAGDMDDDGLPEIIFTRGSSRGGKDAPALFIMEFAPKVAITALPDSINQIKNVRAGIDLDKDGKKEFMLPAVWVDADGVTARRSIFLYENTGNNSYDLVWSYQFPGVADQFTTVDVSDLDGDGNLEILAVNVRAEGDNDAGPNLYVFEYTGADNDYGTEPVVTWDLGNSGRDVVRVAKAADFDGDGKQEVIMTCFLTQPAIVIASVTDFSIPVWTTEYVNNEIGGTAPDIAAIGVGDMDNDGTPEIVLTEGATDKLLIIEATAANTYGINEVDMPVASKTVSVHSIEMGDVNGDGKDEAFIANLQGTVWVVTAPGDVLAITTSDIHAIATTSQQWLEAGLGDLGLGGVDFVIAASNGSTAEDYRYVGGIGGDVTDSTNYVSETVVSLAEIEAIVPGGVRVYGLDLAGDMDKDGLQEIVFTRGSSRGGKDAPSIFIIEVTPLDNTTTDGNLMAMTALPDSINQIKNVRAGIDLDKDGKKEFMFPAVWVDDDGVTARRSIFLYENTGNNSYDLVWSYQFPGVADQFTTVDVSDLDGDGNLEILAVNVRAEGDNDAGPNLYVFEYTGADNDYGTDPVVTWDLGNSGRDVVRVAKAADFDGDGKQEVVMTCFLTQPAIVIASVTDFSIPVWTTEYVNNEIGGTAPDIAAIGVGDMDNDGTPEIVLTEGATDKLLIIEATAANTYGINEVDMPVASKTVSVHGIEMGDVNGDGKDEAFIANLQGTVWVVTAPGDVLAITTGDIHAIATTDQQWLEAGLGDLGLGGFDFVIAASNGSTAEDYRYVGGNGGDVTDSTNYVSETVVSLADIEAIVPGGVRVYGLDFAGDMDDDGLPEIIFTRGSSRGGKDGPAIFIMEITSKVTGLADLFNAIPKNYLLDQNYPNPFNPSTIIKYAVNKPTNVKLTVYDALGQKVATLVNEYQTCNVYCITWNGKSQNGIQVSSGIYFYSLETDFGKITKKMQYIR